MPAISPSTCMIGSRDVDAWDELLPEGNVGGAGQEYLETRKVMGNIRSASCKVSSLNRLGPS